MSFFVGFFRTKQNGIFLVLEEKLQFSTSFFPSFFFSHSVSFVHHQSSSRLSSFNFLSKEKRVQKLAMELASRFIFFPLSPHAAIIDRVQQLAIIYHKHLILFWHRHDTIFPPPLVLYRRERKRKKKEQQRQPADFLLLHAFCFRSLCSSIVARKFDRFAVRFLRRFNHFPKILRRNLSVLLLSAFSFFRSFSQTFFLHCTHARN